MTTNHGEKLGMMVSDDQSRACLRRVAIEYECPFCWALPHAPCFETHGYGERTVNLKYAHEQRRRALYESVARHLATVEAISELMEREARGESWIAARAVIDKAPQMIK